MTGTAGLEPGRLTVRGTGAATARPDRGELALTVTSISRSIQEAMADVSERSARLDAVLDDLAIAADARSTTGVTAHRELAWEDGSQVDKASGRPTCSASGWTRRA